MIRATTGGVLKTYRKNLTSSFIRQNQARETVLTQRNFNTYAEDPGSASRAFQLRRSLMATKSQYQINDSVESKYQSGWTALLSVVDQTDNLTENSIREAVQRARNDPTGDARTALAKEMDQIAEAVVQCMNTKYGETYVFAGADGLNVPFTFEDNKLCYRGIPVDSYTPDVVMDQGAEADFGGQYIVKDNAELVSTAQYNLYQSGGAPVTVDANGQPSTATNAYYVIAEKMQEVPTNEVDLNSTTVLRDASNNPIEVTNADGVQCYQVIDGALALQQTVNGNKDIDANGDYYLIVDDSDYITKADYDTAKSNTEKLEFMSGEKYFVDIGLGMKENNGQLLESTAFNAALVGLNYIGYGVDADGDPKNLVSLVQQMSNLCRDLEPDGSWSASNSDEAMRLAQKLEVASSHLHVMHTDLTASTNKLKTNADILEDNAYNLQEQISDIEDVDMADAISDFIWGQYCYNAALKVGNSILSQSLMDYLN